MAIALGGNSINKAYLGTTEIQKMYLGVDLVFDNSIQPSELTPIMTNFRVEYANKDRVYFSTPLGYPDGMTTTGFVISQKTISTVTKVDDNGGYFTVDSDFNFWSNNTIRLGEITDTSDSQTVLYNFTLEDIDNNIAEPNATGNVYYVNAGATGNGSGDSEANGFTTLQAGFNAATGNGDIIYMKAGTYTTSSHTETNNFGSSDSNNPVKLIGYKTTPGDLDGVRYYSYTNGQAAPALDPSEMPLMEGNKAAAWAIQIEGTDNTIIKNIQFHGYRRSISTLTSGSSNIIIDNCISDYAIWNDGSDNEGSGFHLESAVNTYSGFRISNSLSMNAGMANIIMIGSGGRIKNCNTYSDNSTNSGTYGADYQISVRGSDNVTTNCLIEALLTGNRQGHGLACRSSYSSGEKVYNNLFQHVEINYQCNESIQARNYEANFNVFKDIQITGYSTTSQWGVAMQFQTGAQWNVFERITVDTMYQGIGFITGNESGSDSALLHTSNNLVRNCTFNNIGEALMTWNSSPTTATYEDNSIINCTFNDVDYFHRGSSGNGVSLSGNKLIDCILEGCTTENVNTTAPQLQAFWSFEEANIHNSWATSIGTDSSNLDPQFTGNLLPTNESLMSSRDSRIRYDLNKKQREDVDTTKGAVTLSSENAGTQPPVEDIDYYVALSGDNTDGLTEATAWTSLAKVEAEITSADSGKTIGFKSGDEFYGSLYFSSVDGSDGSPIIFTSYGTGNKPKIRGDKPISFVDQGSNIWKYDAGASVVFHVAKNNSLIPNGRLPKVTDDLATKANYYTITNAASTSNFTSTELIGLGTDALIGAECFVQVTPFDLRQAQITSYNTTTGEVTLDAGLTDLSTGDLFFVLNNENLITLQDEWYWDDANNALYIYSAGEPLGITAITDDVLDTGIELNFGSYIKIDGLEITGYRLCGIQSSTSFGNLDIKNNTITNCLRAGIKTDFENINIESNTIEYTMDYGITVNYRRDNVNILDNNISNIGLPSIVAYGGFENEYTQGMGIRTDNNNSTIKNNRIENVGRNGITVFGAENNLVTQNYIKNPLLLTTDGGGIYTAYATNITTTISYNIVISTLVDAWGEMYGIYPDDNSTGLTCEYNTVDGFSYGIFGHNNHSNIIRYNKLYKANSRGLFLKRDNLGNGDMENNSYTYNDIYIENSDKPMAIVNSIDSKIDFGTWNFNNYFNPNQADTVTVNTGSEVHYTLASWQTLSSQDANSTDDTGLTITDSQVVYNDTNVSVDVPLVGSWRDLSGNNYSESITLAPWSGEILIQPPSGNPELITNGGFDTTLDDWIWSTGGGTAISEGGRAKMTKDNVADYWYLRQDIATDIGSTYNISVDAYPGTMPSIFARATGLDGSIIFNQSATTDKTIVGSFIADHTMTQILLFSNDFGQTNNVCYWDNASVIKQ